MAGLNTKSLLISVGVVGLAIGVLSSVPLVACINCLLCGWVWGGGIGSVWLYRRQEAGSGGTPPTLDTTQGLLLGALAGVVGAIIVSLGNLAFGAASTAAMISQFEQYSGTQIPVNVAQAGSPIVASFFTLIIYAVFGAVGGFIATQFIFKPKAAAPPPAM